MTEYTETQFHPYNEALLLKKMATPKRKNIVFAENGICFFTQIVYPAFIDDIQCENGLVLPKDRYKSELKNAVLFFSKTLEKMTGHPFTVLTDTAFTEGAAIHLSQQHNLSDLTSQGCGFKVAQDRISITSAGVQGITNGIFSFLEEVLGCMFVAADFDYIPCMQTIYLEEKEWTEVPPIQWRSVYSFDSDNHHKDKNKIDYLGWHSKLKLNGAGFDNCEKWCHTSFTFIPPERYFCAHPAYFSEYKGKRRHKQGPVSGQLCFSNEDVYRIISEALFEQMAERPDVHIWDISQMDTWLKRGVGCQCKACKAIDDAQGTPMGSILAFVNRLADECAVRFPENFISTLSYNYSVKPPKEMRPRDNVIIKLCMMPGDCGCSYQNPKSEPAAVAHQVIVEWSRIAKHILIWDYNVNFRNHMMPYPILGSIAANNQFYIDHHVFGVFHQMAWEKGGADAELYAYLFSKVMWNQQTDLTEIMDRYLSIYYGKAAPYLKQYYMELEREVQKCGKPLYIYSKFSRYAHGHLSPANLKKYLRLFEAAMQAVQGDSVLIKRINKAKMSVLYAVVAQFSFDIKGREAALKELMQLCEENRITAFHETDNEKNSPTAFFKARGLELKSMKVAPLVVGAAAAIGVGYTILKKLI